ncbi:BBE domain-containing protein [Streptomyces sp. AcE210]|uniref:BBE domain-containing protein n=1 Tax=Streptomyces sp. AcE210 TaxID=2292703 RepID=UPI0014047266|nr:BBE domain-containing protein [Streptomyces sp. AcE210]
MVNFPSPGEAADRERVRFAYGPERYAGLAAVKKQYNPANLVRFSPATRPV